MLPEPTAVTASLPFDTVALEGWAHRTGLLSGRMRITGIGGGHSNLTYLIEDDDHRLVLRRPPPPPVPPGANDVLREALILRALAATTVPVPRVHAVVPADDVMDVPFYVMDHLEGVVVTDALPPGLDDPGSRRDVAHALVDVLVDLHRLDWRHLGLGSLGRPDGFLQRQVERLPRLIVGPDGRLDDRFAELQDLLRDRMPRGGDAALVHGDLRIGNVMLGTDGPARIVGVLDWELAGIGDPLADLAYTLVTYAVVDEPLHALTRMSTATLADGFPSRWDLAHRYAAATGRDVSLLPWYEGLQLVKLAVLFEYSRRRVVTGGGDPYYDDPGLVDGLLAAAAGAVEHSASTGKDPAR